MLVNTDAMAMSLWAGRLLAAWLKRGIDPELGGITAPVLVLRVSRIGWLLSPMHVGRPAASRLLTWRSCPGPDVLC